MLCIFLTDSSNTDIGDGVLQLLSTGATIISLLPVVLFIQLDC